MLVLQSLIDSRLPQFIKDGGIGVLPTDTIYGVAALATSAPAVDRLYKLKDRHQKPGTIVAANVQQLVDLGIDPALLKQVAHFWPGAISIILPAPESLRYIDHGLGLAVRVSSNPQFTELLHKTGPLVTSSANRPGEPPAGNVRAAQDYFGDQVDFYVQGDDLKDSPPSTVARLNTDGSLEVLRQGAFRLTTPDKL